MLMSSEYCSFVKGRKILRVSEPAGVQKTSHWLSIPSRFAIPNMIAWALLHWFASQMVYLQATNVMDQYENDVHSTQDPRDGLDVDVLFSTTASHAFAILGTVIVTLTLALGARQHPKGILVASTCSVAIALACRPGAMEPDDAGLLPIRFGRVVNENGKFVRAFTSRPVHLKNGSVDTSSIEDA